MEQNNQYGYSISIVDHNNEKWVRVQALGEDFIIAPLDLDDGEDNFSYDEAMARLKELNLDTFSRKQGLIIATLIEEINAKLKEVGGDEFAEDVYVSSEMWHPVDSRATVHGELAWCFSGYSGIFRSTYSQKFFRVRPVLELKGGEDA